MDSPNNVEQGISAKRIVFFDTLRGFTILSMAAFHATYDLAYLFGINMPWFTTGSLQGIWRASISWTFLFLAGWMTQCSRNNAKRGAIYALSALLIYAVTSLVSVDVPISFGILYCMAFCTLTYAACSKVYEKSNPVAGMVLSFCLFVLTFDIPHATYTFSGLSWLGFPAPGFASGDYYPPIPFFFMYSIGVFAAIRFLKGKNTREAYPLWMKRDMCPPLTFIGRHSMLIYLLHQPIILGLLSLVLG